MIVKAKPTYLEKKLALHLRADLSLLEQPEPFWRELTAAAGVRILKEGRAAGVRAFLLAESSLLVWRDRLLLSTCGGGELSALIPWLEARFGTGAVAAFACESPEFVPELRLKCRRSGDPDLLAAWGRPRKAVFLGFGARQFPTEVRGLLPRGAQIFQEHDFEPVGYSCNACEGEEYLTLHFSPELEGSCLSLESRGFEAAHEAIVGAGLRCLSPERVYLP